MSDNYNDIKQLSRPRYYDLHPMPMSDRAAQFSPFAALTGYGDAVDETARLTDSKLELTEDEANELNKNLYRLLETCDSMPAVRVTYFVPDKYKSGGRYVVRTGTVRRIDEYARTLIFADKSEIPIDDMFEITFCE
ncbi:hypothetical protein [Ruminococcus sp. FC2018]|uniref:hypothetical protein n=1 Tax=Ruminococcus sp. FC2018 TaxID=1410617 RepID=UPI00048FF5B0|nr:hypothetical protein [Ruminococcus sp. FC2018]